MVVLLSLNNFALCLLGKLGKKYIGLQTQVKILAQNIMIIFLA